MNINLSVDFTSLAFWGGVPSALFLIRYALQVFYRKASPTGLTSFAMWTMLDCLLLINTIRTGNPIWLPFGWVIGAASVTIALLVRGKWQWTRNETIDAIAVLVAVIISLTSSGFTSLVASTVAMTVAGIPILVENLKVPVRETFMLWFVTIISCILTILGSDYSIEQLFLPVSSLFYNGAMAIIVIRRPTETTVVSS